MFPSRYFNTSYWNTTFWPRNTGQAGQRLYPTAFDTYLYGRGFRGFDLNLVQLVIR